MLGRLELWDGGGKCFISGEQNVLSLSVRCEMTARLHVCGLTEDLRREVQTLERDLLF